MANGYGDYINKQFKVAKEPKTYKTTGTQYNKTEEKERAAIRSQLANDISYWQQKRGAPIDPSKNHVAIAENYYKKHEKRKEVEKAGQKRMSENKGKGKYTAEDRLADSKKYEEKDRKTSSKAYEKAIGEMATSDFKKAYNYSTSRGIVGSDVRFEAFMDKLKKKDNTVARQLSPIPDADGTKKKNNNFLQDTLSAGKRGIKSVSPFDDESFSESSLRNFKEFNEEKSKQFDKVERVSDSVSKFNSNVSNKATGSLWENTILPMMEGFDDPDKKKTELLKELFTGKLNKDKKEGKKPKYELAKPDSKGGKLASDLVGYGLGGMGAATALRGAGLGANTSTKALSKAGALTRAKEGAAIGALMSGTEVTGREVGRPDATNWKQNLAQIGIETGAGAILDPAIDAGLAKLIGKIRKPPTGGGPVEESIAETLAQMPPPPPAPTRGNRALEESIQETLAQMPPPPKGNGPFANGLEPPNLPETAATSTRQPNDIEALMDAYKGKESTNISQGPTRTANDFSNQLDEIQAMNVDLVNPDGTINPLKLKEWQKANAKKQKKNSSEIAPKRLTDSVVDATTKEANYTKGVNVEALKDISGFKGATNDVYRIFDDVFGKDSPVTSRVLGELDASKEKYVNMQESLLKELDEKIVKGLGIKKGSKLSKYVQDYGEKVMDLPTLQQKAPNDWEKVVDADKWFRAKYDELIDQVNESRALVYPNNSSKQIPKRNDYYRHFTEFTGLTGLKNIFDSPGAISPHLAGTSEFTTPRTKWQGFMQQRGLGPYKSDAVGGFLNYAPGASYATHIDPNIPNFRGLKDEIADLTEESKHMNGFVEYLHDYANDLAGKTNPVMDRFIQKYIPGGRSSMAAMSWVNTRVKKNMILGNLGSVLAQLANVPNGLAFAKQHSAKGLGRSMKSIVDTSQPMHNSPFLKERYSDAMYRKFDQKILDQPEKMAGWLIETSDRMGTSFVWNSSYEKGLSQGVSNPIKYADENTRRLIAGRGVGEVPLAQKSKVVQMVAPFTLEVGNLWRVMNDMKKTKDFAGLATLFASNFVLNKVMEEVRGSPVTFDPIDAMVDATNEDLSPLETAGRLGGEVLSNVPAGQFLAGLYPEYGEVGGFKGPTREKLFGERNPQRFGTGLVAMGGVSDPLFKLLTPFGGNQLKKTLGGLETLNNGGSYKNGKGALNSFPLLGETNELQFPVEGSTEDQVKSVLFGQYATDNARDFFNNKRADLSEKQTNEYKKAEVLGRGQEFYDLLMETRRSDTVKRKIKAINEDKSLTDAERRANIEKVIKQAETK